MTPEVRGSWWPAWVALGRVLRAQATARGSQPAFSDPAGTLTRRELWTAITARRTAAREERSSPGAPGDGGSGALVVCSDDARTVVLEALAGLLARRSVVVVSPRAGEHALREAVSTPAGSPGLFFTTSGTTGSQKVVRPRRGICAAAQMGGLLGLLPRRRRPVVACLAPVSHGHGFSAFLATMALGGHFVALGEDPTTRLAALGHVDILTGVPVQLRELADAVDAPPASIDIILSGSDQLTDAHHIGAALGGSVADAYGSTEAGTVTLALPRDRLRSPGTVGRPLPGVRIREQHGRLVVRSPFLGRGEFRSDTGFIRDGLVHVTGRADGVRVTGGENSDPESLRTWLLTMPHVTDVSFEELDDARFGSRLVAHVTATMPVDSDRLRAAIRAEFGPAATPARVEVTGPG